MKEKSIKEFISEMKAEFGSGIAIKVTAPDGSVFKQTDNWIDEELFIKQEKLVRLKWAKQDEAKDGNRYKRK